MKVLEAKFVRGFIRMCNDGWEQGWHERNGGNLSYRIKEEEIESVKEELSFDGEWKEIGASVPKLAKEFFMVTGSGNIFVMLFLILRTVPVLLKSMIKEKTIEFSGEW